MTRDVMYRLLTDMTNETDQTVMESYIVMAESITLNRLFPYDDSVTEVPTRYTHDMLRIAAYLINKRGAEGQLIHIENGTHRSYEAGDIPASLLRHLTPRVGVIK